MKLSEAIKKSVIKRFMSKINYKNNGCWEWNGYLNRDGYGQIYIDGKSYRSNRASWLIFKGELEDDMCVCHRCDNPKCVNPDHLFKGTVNDNNIDAMRKGSLRSGCLHPRAKLTEKEIVEIRNSKLSQNKLSKRYNVSKHAIWQIIKKLSYVEVRDEHMLTRWLPINGPEVGK